MKETAGQCEHLLKRLMNCSFKITFDVAKTETRRSIKIFYFFGMVFVTKQHKQQENMVTDLKLCEIAQKIEFYQ